MRTDLTLHFSIGFLIGATVTVFAHSWTYGMASAALIGLGKEVWDKYRPPHVSDFADFSATVVGGVMGTVLGFFVDRIV